MPISKSALVTATVQQFQKSRLVSCMFFNQEFEFCVQLFFTLLSRNSIFLHSEARLSSIMQNWKKLLSFHYCLPKGVTNFECCILNLLTLKYHTQGLHYLLWITLFKSGHPMQVLRSDIRNGLTKKVYY